MSDRQHITIFTDGACIGNPGPGGYAAVLVCNGRRKEIFGGRRLTTNNRMEMQAAIAALEAVTRPCRATIHSDSQYLVDTIMKGWAARWRANGWKRNRKEYAINTDLWGRLLDLCNAHEVGFVWVRGHDGNAENERCDQLAVAAASAKELPPDEGYEKKQDEAASQPSLFD
jgi:ribonuclease HI